jgi:hypothetical protein
MDELMMILKAIKNKDGQERKFLAAIQGIDLESDEDDKGDITELKGYQAQQEGFGIGLGLGYESEGDE